MTVPGDTMEDVKIQRLQSLALEAIITITKIPGSFKTCPYKQWYAFAMLTHHNSHKAL